MSSVFVKSMVRITDDIQTIIGEYKRIEQQRDEYLSQLQHLQSIAVNIATKDSVIEPSTLVKAVLNVRI